MSTPCILVVDDEQSLVWAVQNSLSKSNYQVLTAYDGVEALAVAQRHQPDLVVLDVIMPYLDGFEVCRKLRHDPTLADVSVLFLTARDAIEDCITGFDRGGDDYLVKPFDLRELKARIGALLRRRRLNEGAARSAEEPPSVLEIGAIRLDLNLCQACIGGEKTVQLTPTECDLLKHLMSHAGETFSSEQLLEQVWGYSPDETDPSLVRGYVKNLRSKIEPDPSHPVYVRTLPRLGYVYSRTKAA
jgi:two-component system, OmpR family, response regulator RpaA